MDPIETDKWYGSKKRPAWAGKVTIKFESILHSHYGKIIRTTEVIGIVAPGSTSGRPSAPEPISNIRVSTAKNEPARYQYDPETGINAYNTGFVDAEKGHIMALELGGPDIPENIVPQWAKWQGCGEWRKMEQQIYDLAVKGNPTDASKSGYFLMFHGVINYPTQISVENAGLRRVCTPKGFTVCVTPLDRTSLKPIGPPQVVFNGEQQRDETDDKLAMRAFERLEGEDMDYDDWVKKGTDKKSKGEFKETGQDPLYRPPPITSKATKFDLTAYMQQCGIGIGLDGKVDLDEDDGEYQPTDSDGDHKME
jgi:hypothetical protein